MPKANHSGAPRTVLHPQGYPVVLPAGVAVAPWGTYAESFTGTAEALVAAGIVRPDQLPGAPGNPKTMVTYRDGVRAKGSRIRGPGHLQVFKIGQRFRVVICLAAQEAERRADLRHAQIERERQQERERAREAFLSDTDSLRFQLRATLRMLTTLVSDHTEGDHERGDAQFFCQVAPEGAGHVLDALSGLSEWAESVEITPVSRTHINAKAARSDPQFQAFLQSQCFKG